MQVASRLGRLRNEMADSGAPPALLVTNLTSVRYLTGFTGSAGMLFVLPEDAVLLTDGRYETQAEEQLTSSGVAARIEVAAAAGQAVKAAEVVTKYDLPTLALEAAHVSWARQRVFAQTWFPHRLTWWPPSDWSRSCARSRTRANWTA